MKKHRLAAGVALVVESLPSNHEILSSNSNTAKKKKKKRMEEKREIIKYFTTEKNKTN
jgi:hypothetical protein